MTCVGIGSDVRYAVRTLLKRPVFLTAAVLSIGIGGGLNVGIYAVLRHVLFDSPLTSAAPDRFLRIQPGMSFPNYSDLRQIDLPLDLAAMQMGILTWQTDVVAQTVSAHLVSD